ncbi:hypothetical protein ACN28I_21575 [Archangium gephyra]|uniref:hypothetical protein n=1 Tax=Archangium gephyra TaxID=48 RepID=UPI003B7B0AE3
MAIYAYALVGMLVGLLARVILPPTRLVGFWGSLLLGGIGGLLGGVFSSMLAPVGVTERVHPLGIAMALIVSALVSLGVMIVTRNKRFA